MVITLDPRLDAALLEAAKRHGVAPETLVVETLTQRFVGPSLPVEPRDEWERSLLALATNCGVSLSDEAVSSEGIYE